MTEGILTDHYRFINEGCINEETSFIKTVWEKIKAFAKTVWEKIKAIVSSIVAKIKASWEWLKKKLSSEPKGFIQITSGGKNSLKGSVSAMNLVIAETQKGIHATSNFDEVKKNVESAKEKFVKSHESNLSVSFSEDGKAKPGFEIMGVSEYEEIGKQIEKLSSSLSNGVSQKSSAINSVQPSEENKEKLQNIQFLLQTDIFLAGSITKIQSNLNISGGTDVSPSKNGSDEKVKDWDDIGRVDYAEREKKYRQQMKDREERQAKFDKDGDALEAWGSNDETKELRDSMAKKKIERKKEQDESDKRHITNLRSRAADQEKYYSSKRTE